MFKHILVPTDGSKLSEKAIKHAVRLAKRLEARVTAFHVLPKYHAAAFPDTPTATVHDEFEAAESQRAHECLRFAQRVAHSAGVDCDVAQARSDQPYREIIKAAQRAGCDLILMASHGRRGIEGFLLGSETQKVLTHSATPVLVYR